MQAEVPDFEVVARLERPLVVHQRSGGTSRRGLHSRYSGLDLRSAGRSASSRDDEGLAIHIGPESCAVAREGFGEALTGGRIGQPLSRERFLFWVLSAKASVDIAAWN